jgi:small-conductance mechanosensitive channel
LVERVLLEAAHEAIRDGLEGLLAKPEPSVAFIPGFGDSSWNFSLGMQVRQFTDQFPVQSELRKRIVKKFKDVGIHMPFPTRTLLLGEAVKDRLSGTSHE